VALAFRGLDKEHYDRNYSDWELLKRIAGYFWTKKFHMLVISVSLFLGSLANTFIPVYISKTLDSLKDGITTQEIITVISLLVGLNVLAFLFNFLTQASSGRAIGDVVLKIREDMFDALMKRDMAFYDKTPTGKIVSRVTNDTNDFGNVVSLTANVLSQLLIVVLITYFIAKISLFLTFYTLLIAPIVVLVALAFRKVARQITLQSNRVIAQINKLIQETVTGIFIAKMFRAEKKIYEEFLDVNENSYKINLRRGLILNLLFPILSMITGIGMAFIIYAGGLQAINSVPRFLAAPAELLGITVTPITPGEWYLFVQAINYMVVPLVSVASFWSQFQAGLSASERVFALIDAENTVVQKDNIDPGRLKGRIEFKNVTFHYEDGTKVFEKLNVTINPGETVAIVGHTGAGKSSFAKLIARFYEFQGGKILIDEYDIRTLDLNAYRRQLSYITQEVFLWSGTIEENLKYGYPDVPQEKLNKVLEEVHALDWIKDLPEGLKTHVGERGSRLSMGQRQIIAFARVLLENPSILIMDEATASIDPLTESLVQDATKKLLAGRTSIIIAHRLSTVKHADRILVFKEGKIIEEGNHEELMKQGKHYAELYNTYFRHQSLEYVENLPKIVGED